MFVVRTDEDLRVKGCGVSGASDSERRMSKTGERMAFFVRFFVSAFVSAFVSVFSLAYPYPGLASSSWTRQG